MPQANPTRKKMLAKKAAYKKAVTAKANQKKGMFRAGKYSNIKTPTSKPRHKGNTDAKGNTTNLKTKKK